jgi:hypothetical protein
MHALKGIADVEQTSYGTHIGTFIGYNKHAILS